MTLEYIIYFEDRKFVITRKLIEQFTGNSYGFFWGNPTLLDFSKLLEIFQLHKSIQNLFVEADDVDSVFEQFSLNFTLVDAAGGLVTNEQGEYLFIRRCGKWDLPKGKVEKHEKIVDAAVREVMEETGLTELTLQNLISVTYHTYIQNGINYLKRTYWYAMHAPKNQSLIPQVNEDIALVEWVNKSQIQNYLSDSFGSIRQVFVETGL